MSRRPKTGNPARSNPQVIAISGRLQIEILLISKKCVRRIQVNRQKVSATAQPVKPTRIAPDADRAAAASAPQRDDWGLTAASIRDPLTSG